MKTTKLTLTLLLSLGLTACLQSPGGSSPTAAIAFTPESPIEPEPGEETPEPSPTLTYADIESSTLTSAYGNISITNNMLTDSFCGHTYPITSSSESNGIVTVSVDGWSGSHSAVPGQGFLVTGASWTNPGHSDCQVDVLPHEWYYYSSSGSTKVYFGINGTYNGNPASYEIAYRIVYQFEKVDSTITVNRTIKSRPYRRSGLNAYGTYTTVESQRTLAEMNYNQ